MHVPESKRNRTSIFTDAKARKKPVKKRTFDIAFGIASDAAFNSSGIRPKLKAKRLLTSNRDVVPQEESKDMLLALRTGGADTKMKSHTQ